MAAEKPTPPFDTFVFDVDGTLLDTLDDLVVLTNDALAEFNLPPRTREEINSYVGNGVKALMYQAVPEGTPQDVADACLARWKENYGTYPNDLTKPYPGIPALLAALHGAGVKLGVVSKKEDALTKSVVSHYFPGLFDAVAGHTLGTPTKPDPHLVNGMRAAFGLSAQQVLYVGDSGVDIETARNAGLAGCGVLWGFRTGDELCGAGASYLVRSPEDIRVLVLDA